MGRAVGTISFFESFYGRLVLEGCTFVNGLSGQGRFLGHSRTSQWASPLPCVNTAWRYRSFLCHSHAGHQAVHSANEHRGLHRDSLAKLNRAACPKAVSESVWQLGHTHAITEFGCPSHAASAPMSSWQVHAWLHWPKLSAIKNTGQCRGHAIVKHQRRFQGQGLQSFGGFVHRANCRFNSDKNAPHFFRLTWR